MRGKRYGWTDVDLRRLLRLHADGLSVTALSQRFGCSRACIRDALHKADNADSDLAEQIAIARAEAPTTPPYKRGELEW